MSQLKFKAGDFEISTWTNGFPMWMEIKYRDETISVHHRDLKDLAFIIDRMRVQARAQMSENYKHEFD